MTLISVLPFPLDAINLLAFPQFYPLGVLEQVADILTKFLPAQSVFVAFCTVQEFSKSSQRSPHGLLIVFLSLMYSEAQVTVCPYSLQALGQFSVSLCLYAILFGSLIQPSPPQIRKTVIFLKILLKPFFVKSFAKVLIFSLTTCVLTSSFCQKSSKCLHLPCYVTMLFFPVLSQMIHEAMVILSSQLSSIL